MITPFFSLEEIRQRIFDDDTTKAIKLDRDHSGGKRKIYICHDCMLKVAIVCKRGENTEDLWELTHCNLEHGKLGDDGLIAPCLGSRRPSIKAVAGNKIFQALINSQSISGGKLTTHTVQASIAETLRTPVPPTKDVIKKARQIEKKRGRAEGLLPVDDIVDISEMSNFLNAVKVGNPTFNFKINAKEGLFENVLVLMPYAAAVLECCYKIIGIDGGHGKEVEIGSEHDVLRKVHVITLTTRSPNNKMSILAFVVTLTSTSIF